MSLLSSSRRGSYRRHQLMPNLESSETVGTIPAKIGSHTLTVGDDVLSQAMVRLLERVTGTHSGYGNQGGDKLFRGIARVTPIVSEYWLEATEHIMNDINCTHVQKLRSVVSLLQDEAYQWWLTVEQSTQLDQIT
ncbi:1-phosphatidylinositol-4,5-bisphosphate phosphodiesterase beta-2 [Gossypium australe]|uniref:1-phosphatidylinositol-4,5-bisphosphate phosphodiesterase beta-2 n=1 Tax=Gossypium australe TaxID=47621 RepID=A0A5B6VAZ1_9ROSI|nr:1-phosphatidylinositol-4,5-bisphosphate phosphodiesterase beta-2 [Gossypium australe]